jgi:hypothetical protein
MKIKKNYILIFCVLLSVVLIALVIGFTVKGIKDRNQYKQFLLDFDKSISFSLKRNSLKAELEGTSTRLTSVNARKLYSTILNAGYCYYDEEIPESKKTLYLYFESGEEMWILAENENADGSPLIINYLSSPDKSFMYVTQEEVQFAVLERLASVEYDNPLWDD